MKKFFRGLHKNEKGFTLIELLVTVAILGTLSGVATANLGSFIGTGQEEAKNAEGHNVQVAVVAYLAKGNTITEEFTVTPSDQGVLDPYLIGNLVYSWTVSVDGSVSPADDEPEPKPKPKPWPNPKPKPMPI